MGSVLGEPARSAASSGCGAAGNEIVVSGAGSGSASAQGQQEATELAERSRGDRHRAGAEAVQQFVVECRDHHVGGQRFVVDEVDRGDRTRGGLYPRGRCVVTEACSSLPRPGLDRVDQGADPTDDLPGAESVFQPGPEHRRGRRQVRVGAQPQQVAGGRLPQPRILQVTAHQIAIGAGRMQRGVRGTQLARRSPPGCRRHRSGRKALPELRPDLVAGREEGVPLCGRRRAECRCQRVADARPGCVRQVDDAAVGELPADGRVHRPQLQDCLEWAVAAGLDEQVAPPGGQLQQGRAGVEPEAVALQATGRPAGSGGPLDHGHVVPQARQAGGDREPGQPGPDHHHPGQRLPQRTVRVTTEKASPATPPSAA